MIKEGRGEISKSGREVVVVQPRCDGVPVTWIMDEFIAGCVLRGVLGNEALTTDDSERVDTAWWGRALRPGKKGMTARRRGIGTFV